MELRIENFRSIVSENYFFNRGNNLITGESGVGKSSILEAIIWCFYGGSNVTPFSSGKKTITKVVITVNNYKITRTKPPDKCKIEINEKILEHDEAQEYINNLFGGKSLWETSSYLKQDSRSNLIFNSSQEKYSLIKEIIFGREENENSPDAYLKKTSEFSKELDLKITRLEGKLEILEILKNNLPEKPNEIDKKREKKVLKYINKHEIIKKKIEDGKLEIFKASKLSENKNRLSLISKELEKFPDLSLNLIEKWKNWLKWSSKIIDEEYEIIPDNIDLEYLENLDYNYKKDKENREYCKKFNIDYDKEELENTMIITKEKIEIYERYIEYKKIKDKFDSLIEKENIYENGFNFILNKMKIKDTGFTKENLKSVEIELAKTLTSYLICPKCNQKLILENSKLVDKEFNFMKQTEIEKIKKNLKNIIVFYEKKNEFSKELDKFKGKKLKDQEDEDIENLREYYENLKGIDILDFDREQYFKIKKSIEIQEIEEKIENNYDPIFEKYEAPENFSYYFKEYQALVSEKKILEKEINSEDNSDPEKVREGIQKLEEIVKDIENYKVFKEHTSKEKEIEELDTEYKNLIIKKNSCFTIKKIIEEESSVTLENLITSFNDMLNEIVAEIFEDIYIELSMFKKLKGKKETKTQFNMKVMLKGNEYDNLNFLSGGEKDRISIALILTLSTLLNNPIIMFDESMSSLDEEMRERCLDLIKKYASDKILINICHSTIEGYYDNIIRL